MADSEKVIKRQLEKQKIKRDVDVEEIYLAKCDLVDVTDLSRFKNLKQLWLNGNKLRRIDCLSQNFRLSELHLENNKLVEINGVLQHLTSLEVLFLHNNQLEKLQNVIKELRKMQNLKVLNLFNNPIAQESEYRIYTIFHCPSVQLLDRSEVLKSERDYGYRLYDQENEMTKDTIAFGRRSEGPPALHYPGGRDIILPTTPVEYEVGNNFYRNNPPFANDDQAVAVRALRRSIMEYSSFDWSKIPRAFERRQTNVEFERPQVVTNRFR